MACLILWYDELEEAERSLRRQRVFRDRLNPLEKFEENEIIQRFRFDSNGIRYLADLLNDELEHATKRNHSVPVIIQICAALRFYASGGFLQLIGDSIHLSKSTVCIVVRNVSKALVRRMPQYISFPTTSAEVAKVRRELAKVANIPGVTGLIDCTHVKIIGPSHHENEFVNRKGYHSINCQFICRENGIFTNCVAKWPGSNHDSIIFSNSTIGQMLESGQLKGYLLGDSGYPCRRWILTPYLQPAIEPERNFNKAHKKTRSQIEQAFGRFKKRFYGLHSGLRVNPEKACLIIGACAVLHNIAILLHQPDEFDENIDNFGDFEEVRADANVQLRVDGQSFRSRIVERHFT